jgi:O-antigen ligase
MSALFAVAHMQDIVALAAPASLLLMLGVQLRRLSVPSRLPREATLVLLLVAFLALNMALNHSLAGIDLLDFFRDPGRILYMLLVFGVFLLRAPEDRLELALYPAAFYTATVIAAVSLFSAVVSPVSIGEVSLSGPTRLHGALNGANPTAGSLGAVLILFLVAALHQRRTGAPLAIRGWHWICVGLIFAAVLMTKSRGYILALLMTAAALYAPSVWRSASKLRFSPRAVVVGLLVLAGLVVTRPALESRLQGDLLRDPTVVIRMQLFSRAWSLALRSPLAGLGLGTFEQHSLVIRDVVPGVMAVKESGRYAKALVPMTPQGGLHAHNVVLQLLCEIGLVGIGLLAGMYWCVCARGRALRKRVPGPGEPGGMLAVADLNGRVVSYLLVYLVIAGMSAGYTLVSPSTSWLLYVLMARVVRQHGWLSHAARLDSRRTVALGGHERLAASVPTGAPL